MHRGGGTPGPILEEIEWRTRDPLPPGQMRNRRGWQPWSPQPTDRSFGETVLTGRGVRLSAPIPQHSFSMEDEELERLKEERQALEAVRQGLERQEKKLVVLVTDIARAEERIGIVVEQLEKLEPMLQNFATLMSRMSEVLDHYEVRQIRQR